MLILGCRLWGKMHVSESGSEIRRQTRRCAHRTGSRGRRDVAKMGVDSLPEHPEKGGRTCSDVEGRDEPSLSLRAQGG